MESRYPINKHLLQIINLSPGPVYVCAGEDFRVIYANEATLRVWGKDESVIGKPFVEALPEIVDQPFPQLLKNVYELGVPYYTEQDRADLPVDGVLQTYYFKFSYQPLKDEDERIWGVLCFATDVTELVKARQVAEENKEQLEEVANSLGLALESADMGTWKAHVINDVVTVSPRARSIYGAPEQGELTSAQIANLIDPDYRSATLATIRKAIEAKEKFEIDFLINPMDGGAPKWIRSTGKAFYNSEGKPLYVFGTISDITIQRNKEETLKYRKALLEAQKEAIPGALLVVDTKGSILSYNDEFVTLWRIPRDIMVNKDDSAALQFAMTQLADPEEFIRRVNYCYAHPDEATHEEVLFKDGRVIERFGKAVKSEDGSFYGWAWYFRDITKALEIQKQKDEFISTVSHELKTPVTSIKAYAQLLDRSLSKLGISSHESFLSRMDAQVRRLETLIRELLDVTRVDAGKFDLLEERFDVSDMLRELTADLQVITTSHKLVLLENDPVKINADKGRITQVITNLVNNAVKYSPESETVYISSSLKNGLLVLSVKDFGIGIPNEQKPFLFERFHQAERSNAGAGLNLGLGLYICKQIIDRSGGEIWFDSEVGKGSTFYFSLPCCL